MLAFKKILVIDDDKDILDALCNVLEYGGYNVNTLSSGDKVLEKIDEYHPDLILLDVMLADMDGRDICQNIKEKENTAEIPVILISATHNLDQCLKHEGPPDDFLAKPFDINTLFDKVQHHLNAA